MPSSCSAYIYPHPVDPTLVPQRPSQSFLSLVLSLRSVLCLLRIRLAAVHLLPLIFRPRWSTASQLLHQHSLLSSLLFFPSIVTMLLSSSSIISVLFVFAIFSQDVDASMSRRRHVPGRAGLQSHKARRAPAVMGRSVESDQSSLRASNLNPRVFIC